MDKSFNRLLEESVKDHWNLDALTDYKGATLQFKDVARKIEKMHIMFEAVNIKPGWTKQFSLGRSFLGHPDLRSSDSTHPS